MADSTNKFSVNSAKWRITSSIRELDRSDLIDICQHIKIYIPGVDGNIIAMSARGTYINLDLLDDQLLQDLDNIVVSKLQRIYIAQN